MALLVIAVAVVLWLLSRNSGGAGGSATLTSLYGSTPSGGTTTADYGLGSIAQAVASVESGGQQTDANGNVIASPAGAIGIMQLMPGTAAQLGVNPYDAQQNYAGGETYLQQLYAQYGDWPDALAAYNWGPGNVNQALASGSAYPQSVQQYIAKVLAQLQG